MSAIKSNHASMPAADLPPAAEMAVKGCRKRDRRRCFRAVESLRWRMSHWTSRWVAVSGAILLACAAIRPAQSASTMPQAIQVTVTVTPACRISANPLSLDSATAPSSRLTRTATLSVTCTNTTPYNIGLEGGVPGASVTVSGTGSGSAQSVTIRDSVSTQSSPAPTSASTVTMSVMF